MVWWSGGLVVWSVWWVAVVTVVAVVAVVAVVVVVPAAGSMRRDWDYHSHRECSDIGCRCHHHVYLRSRGHRRNVLSDIR